jgi:hypothetical protein
MGGWGIGLVDGYRIGGWGIGLVGRVWLVMNGWGWVGWYMIDRWIGG